MSDKKRAFLEKFNDAFAKGDTDFIVSSLTDDIRWTMVGDSVIEGKETVAAFMEEMEGDFLPTFTMEHVIIEGDKASVVGEMSMPDEFGQMATYTFCDVYVFDGGEELKIKELKSFVVEAAEEEEEE